MGGNCSCSNITLPSLTEEQQSQAKVEIKKVIDDSKDLLKLYDYVIKEKISISKSNDLEILHKETVEDENIKSGSGVNWGMVYLIKDVNTRAAEVLSQVFKDALTNAMGEDTPAFVKEGAAANAISMVVSTLVDMHLKENVGKPIVCPDAKKVPAKGKKIVTKTVKKTVKKSVKKEKSPEHKAKKEQAKKEKKEKKEQAKKEKKEDDKEEEEKSEEEKESEDEYEEVEEEVEEVQEEEVEDPDYKEEVPAEEKEQEKPVEEKEKSAENVEKEAAQEDNLPGAVENNEDS